MHVGEETRLFYGVHKMEQRVKKCNDKKNKIKS